MGLACRQPRFNALLRQVDFDPSVAGDDERNDQIRRTSDRHLCGGVGICCPRPADLQICNRMSYVVEAAHRASRTRAPPRRRGWFRIDPGQCRTVLQGALTAESILSSTPARCGLRRLAAAAGRRTPISASRNDNFASPARAHCRTGQRSRASPRSSRPRPRRARPPISPRKPNTTDEQARDAGIQRLLVIAGYDAKPIDGIARRQDRRRAACSSSPTTSWPTTAAGALGFLRRADRRGAEARGSGFAWCNETPHPVMAALGVEDKGAVMTRGWYRVEPGKCLRPD